MILPAYFVCSPLVELSKQMEALRLRIGHTHPPQDYIRIDQILSVLRSQKSLFDLLEYKVIEKPESDTDRYWWILAARYKGVPSTNAT